MDDLIEKFKDKIPEKILKDFKKEALNRKLTKKDAEKVLEHIRDEYERAKIDPGESIGVITAESFGEPGTQMCTSYDEKVILKFKNQIRIVKIGEFVDEVFSKVDTRNKDGYEIYNVPDELLVLSLNNKEKLKWKKVLALNRVKAPKQLITIKTKSGRSITATDFHSFVTRKNNEVVPVAGKDLHLGDRLPVMRYLPEHCISSICVSDYVCDIPKQTKLIPNIMKLDELFGWFIGAYLAEGNASKHFIGISNVNDNYINNAKKFAQRINLNYNDKSCKGEFAISRTLNISSTLLSKLVKILCNTGSKYKKVPDFAYSAKEEFVSGLLRGYFDGDGNVTLKRKMIRASSNSEDLIKGISLLLNRFKIFSRISKDKKGQYKLSIPYNYTKIFLEKIGLDIPVKREKLEKLSKLVSERKIKSLDQVEMISGFGNLFYDTAKKLGIRTRFINNFTKRQKIGRATLSRYIKKFERVSVENNINISEKLKLMKQMLNSDVVWDEIVEIKYVKPKSDYVYDLSVPGLKTFTTFDGIVTHNTLNVFHFAGVAEVSVSSGLPRIIELFDARKTIKTPMMEIFLEDPYSKDAKKVRKLAAKIKEIKLNELATDFLINIASLQVEVVLNTKKLSEIGLTPNDVSKKVGEEMKTVKVNLSRDKLVLKTAAKENELIELYKLKEKSKDVYVSGIKKIKQVLPVKNKGEFMILTAGTNLKDVLNMKGVDSKRTICNDLFEVRKVLGIEAARQVVINESLKVIEDQGLDIDLRHIMFIADILTSSSNIKGITRSGITGDKASVLARASFETPIKHIINASLLGEKDPLNSVIENVIINQPVPLGTGLPDLMIKMIEK